MSIDEMVDPGVRVSREPAQAGPRLAKHEQIADAGGSALPLLLTVLTALNRQNIAYCYWKSGRRLDAALSGKSDLDLLVAPADWHRMQAVLLTQDFKRFPEVASHSHPAVLSYFGYDEGSGRIVHLHLHFALIVGAPLLKNYWLRWESPLLSRSILHPTLPIRVLDNASEALLLVTRACLEPSLLDPIGLRHRAAIDRKFEADRVCLSRGLDRLALRNLAGEFFTDDVAEMIVESIFSDCPLAAQRRLRHRIRKELAPYRMYDMLEARFRSTMRCLAWALGHLNKRVFRLPRPWNRHAPGGGRVIAFVGVDGCGKSTMVAATAKWLGSKVDVAPAYFGTGDGRPSLLLMPFKILASAIRPLLGSRAKDDVHSPLRCRAHGLVYSLLLMVWAIAVAAEKRIKLRSAHRGARRGIVVFADRYPQNEDLQYNDSPILPRLPHVPGWLRHFEASSYALARRLPPDLVVKLEAMPETIARREPGMHPAVIGHRVKGVHELGFPGARVVSIDAEQPLEDVLRSVKRAVWTVL